MSELTPIGGSVGDFVAMAAECVGSYERSPFFWPRETQRKKEAEAEESEWLNALCESALSGVFGPEVRDEAAEILIDPSGKRRTDVESMRAAHPIIRNAWARTGKRRYEPRSESRGRRAAE